MYKYTQKHKQKQIIMLNNKNQAILNFVLKHYQVKTKTILKL